MKNRKIFTKPFIAIIIAVAIISTALVITSVANAKETAITITTDKSELSAGQSATVSVKVATNYPVATMSIPVFYDDSLVSVSDATATLSDYTVKSAVIDSQSADSGKIYANTDVSAENFGFVLVNYIGGAGETVSETLDAVVLTFKITAKVDVSGTAVIKCDSKSAKTDTNTAGMLYFGAVSSGTTINDLPENVENIDMSNAQTNVTVSGDGTVLIANNELTGYIDTDNNYVYGIPVGTTAEDFSEYFTVSNGSFEMVANAAGYNNGTGATLKVLDANGNEVTSYTLIIFGDVNFDGQITAADKTAIDVCILGNSVASLTTEAAFAADVNGDGSVLAADKTIVDVCILSGDASTLTNNPYK